MYDRAVYSINLQVVSIRSRYFRYSSRLALVLSFLVLVVAAGGHARQPSYTTAYLKGMEGEEVQFAYAYLDLDSTSGVFSDIDGKIRFESTYSNFISVSHPDYHTQVFELPSYPGDSIVLRLSHRESRGVHYPGLDLVDSGRYIIEKVIANERLHDPERLGGSFKYQTYNKTVVDLYQLADHRLSEKYKAIVKDDSLFHKHHRVYGEQHVEVIETITERTFEYPRRDHEKVLGLKVTGLHEDEITPLTTNLHPISFYRNYFDFLGVRYASPVGLANYKKYDFHHESTLKVGEDTVYIVSFRPSHLRFPGLVGRMYINSNQYAIQHIVVEPAQSHLADFQIACAYEFVDGKEWFPKQLNYLYSVDKFPKPYLGTVYDKKTYIKDVEIDPDLTKEEKKVELVFCDHYATRQAEEFWNTHRIVPLTKKERLTYLRVDTLRHQSTMANLVQRVGAFYKQDLNHRVPPVVVFHNIFALGRYEGARLGLGAKLGKDIFKVMGLHGYGAYGFRDKAWKYGYGADFFLNKKHDALLRFEHQKEIREPGNVIYINKEKDFFRTVFIGNMNSYESNHVKLSFRTPGYHLLELGLHDYTEVPQYDYRFLASNNEYENHFDVTEFTLRTRIAVKERITHTLGQVNRIKSSYPVLYINYNRGITNMFNGEYDFNKISASLGFKFRVGHIGESDIAIEAGDVEKNLPYILLFNGRGGNMATSSVIIEDHFQTMGLYEFVSNRFLNIFYAHDFGNRIFAGAKLRPDIVVYHHVGWGELYDMHRHSGQDVSFQSYNKGYVESGLGFNNLIKYKFFGKLYGGLGLSFFYRYGPHRNPGGFSENFATRITYVMRGI